MIIRLTDSMGNLFTQVDNWELANIAAKAIWKREKWSDLFYFIEFDTKQEFYGAIDLEPRSHFAPVQNSIFTWHLKTFLSNMVKIEPQKAKIFEVSKQDIQFFKYLLTELPC